ncbi:MAG: hypothetical protein U0R19_38300 [Bryobacteraceae bacterium]
MSSVKLILALALPAMSWGYETKFFHIQQDGNVLGANTSKTTVSVSHGSTGVYVVNTPNVMYAGQTVGPIPLVTAVGSDSRFCKVGSFNTAQTTVLCFAATGLAADSGFFLWFIPANNDREISFAYAFNPTAAFYPAPHHYTTNGGQPTVTRTGTGRYTVAFPGLNGGTQSHVQVTAAGSGPVSCAPIAWDTQNSAFTVTVKCGVFTTIADSEFTVAVIPPGANPRALGYASVNVQSLANTAYNYNPEGGVTVTGGATSSSGYVVTFQGLNINRYPGMNAVVSQVTTAAGVPPGRCKVGDFFEDTGTDLSLLVRCYDGNGNPATSNFAIAIMPREYLLNAGFEAPPVLGSPISAPLLGWTLVSGQATIQRLSGQPADDGNQWTRLSTNGNNTIFYQDVDTVPGTGYDLRFAFSNRAGAPSSSIRVRWGGQVIATIVRTNTAWQTYSYTVYGGNGSTTRLQFESLGGGTECDFLDDVRVVYNPSAPPPPAYTIQTSPSGHPITVDGTSYTAPQTFYWGANTQHSISVETVRDATPGTRLVFTNWTGPSFQTTSATTTITVPATAATYTANYGTIQHLLSLTVAPVGGGTVSVSPAGSSGYHNDGTTVTLIASPNTSFGFAGYSGSVTSSSQTVQVLMNAPKWVNATFSGCTYTLAASSATFAASGGEGSVGVTTLPGCPWTVANLPAWIQVVQMTANLFRYTVAQNTGAARSAQITVAGKPYTVSQAAGATGCTYTLSSAGTGVLPASGAFNLSVSVTTQAGCSWTVTNLQLSNWTTTTTTLPITGSGFFYFNVLLNPGQERSTTIMVAGQHFHIEQAAAQGCVYGLNPSGAIQIPASGATGSVWINTNPGCSWTVTSLPSWITAIAILPDVGPGTFDYTVQPNSGAARTAEVVIAGQNVTFQQAGVIPPPTQTAGLRFKPLAPCRLVETRPEYNDPARTGLFGPPYLNAGQSRELVLPQSPTCVVPANAKAYVLNVTVIPRPGGVVDFVTVWPTGEARPNVWTVRSPDGQTVANAQIVKAGTGGGVSLYTSHASDFVIDISGYFTDDAAVSNLVFYPMTPCRVIETRSDYRSPVGPFGPPSMLAKGTRSFRFPLATQYCTIPAGAAAYSVTLTVVPPGPLPFLTTWPTGGSLPNVSSINSFVGRQVANHVIVPANGDGSIDVYAFEATDFIMDINGYFAPDNGTTGQFYFPVTQCRVYNTQGTNAPAVPNESTRTVNMVTGPCTGIPADARGYAMNVTAIPNGNAMPFLTVYPTGQGQPNASVLNAFQGQTVTNFTIVPAGTQGQVNVYAYRRTDVVVEVNGYFGR